MGKFELFLQPTQLVKNMHNLLHQDKNSRYIILVRSCENIGSLSGCLNGWIDAKLSEYGRKQAKFLSLEYFSHFENSKFFRNVYLSDLLRSKETAEICMGYDFKLDMKILPELREIYFGKDEGLFYDGLSKENKSKINKTDHRFEDGESLLDVKYRALKFIDTITRENTNLISEPKFDIAFTQGGFITSLLYGKNFKSIPPNGSIIVLSIANNANDKNLSIDKFSPYYRTELNYNNNRENLHKIHEKFNRDFEDSINTLVNDIEFAFNIPDLTEELL